MRYIFSLMAFLLVAISAEAGIVVETVEYKHGETVLEGYLAN